MERQRRAAKDRNPFGQAHELHTLLAGIGRIRKDGNPCPDKTATDDSRGCLHGRTGSVRVSACRQWEKEQKRKVCAGSCDRSGDSFGCFETVYDGCGRRIWVPSACRMVKPTGIQDIDRFKVPFQQCPQNPEK